MKLREYYYKDLFNREVPASFTEIEKSEFLQFCLEFSSVLSGHGRFCQGRLFYFFDEISEGEGIEVLVYKYDETGQHIFLEEIILKNVLELFYFFKGRGAYYCYG